MVERVDISGFVGAGAEPPRADISSFNKKRTPRADISEFVGAQPGAPVEGTPDQRADISQFLPGRTEQLEPQGLGAEFEKGASRNVTQFQETFFGLASVIGESFDSDELRGFAKEGLEGTDERLQGVEAAVGSISNIENAGDFFLWAAGVAGSQSLTLASMLTAGGIGATIARKAAANSIRKRVRDAATAHMRKQAFVTGERITERQIRQSMVKMLNDPIQQGLMNKAMVRGAATAVIPLASALETAGIQNELVEAGFSGPSVAATALTFGTAAGALEGVLAGSILKRFFPGVAPRVAKGWVRNIAEATGQQNLLEGSTEAAQELIALTARAFHDPTFDITSPENLLRIADSAAAGALIGTITGSVSGSVTAARDTVTHNLNVRKGTERMRQFVTGNAERIVAPKGRKAAESLLPGIQELRDAGAKFMIDTVAPLLAGVRVAAQAGLDQAREVAGDGVDIASIEDVADFIDEQIRTSVGPEFQELADNVNQIIEEVQEQAAKLPAAERAAFVAAQLVEVKNVILDWTEQRIKPAAAEAETSFEDKIRTADYGDEDNAFIEESAFLDETLAQEGIFVQDTQRAVFGQSRTVKRTVTNRKTGKTTTVSSTFRQRGDSVIPFATVAAAQKAIDSVTQTLKGTVAPGLIEVVPNETKDISGNVVGTDGFVIAVNEVGAAEELFDQLRFIDGIRTSTASARANPDPARRIKVIKPDAKPSTANKSGFVETQLDLPSLALTGADIAERGDVEVREDAVARAVQGLDTILARMLDQGYVIVDKDLSSKTLIESRGGETSLTITQARAAAQADLDPLAADRVELAQFDNDFREAAAAVSRAPPGATETSSEQLRLAAATAALKAARVRFAERAKEENRPDFTEFDTLEFADLTADIEQPLREGETEFDRQRISGVDVEGPVFDNPDLSQEGSTQTPGLTTESAANAASLSAPSLQQRTESAINWHRAGPGLNVALGGLPEAVQLRVMDLIQDLVFQGGLDRIPITVVDRTTAGGMYNADHPIAAEIEKAVAEDPVGRIIFNGKEAVIYLSDRILLNENSERQALNTFAVVAHEIGHLVEFVHYDRLPTDLKAKLNREWEAAGAVKSFEEWMADQFVGFAAKNAPPRTAIESFFDEVIKSLRKILAVITQQYGVTETFEQFMQAVGGVVADNRSHNDFLTWFSSAGSASFAGFKLPSLRVENAVRPGSLDAFEDARDAQVSSEVTKLTEERSDLMQSLIRLVDKTSEILNNLTGQTAEFTDEFSRRRLADIANKAQEDPRIVRLNEQVDDVNRQIDALDDQIAALSGPEAQVPLRAADFDVNDLLKPKMSAVSFTKLKEIIDNHPGLKQAGVRSWDMMLALHAQFTQTLDGRLRSMNFGAAQELARRLQRPKGEARDDTVYYGAKRLAEGIFGQEIQRIFKDTNEQQQKAAIDELIALDGQTGAVHQNPLAAEIADYLRQMNQYMQDRGLEFEVIPNYFPRIWDAELVRVNRDKIFDMIVEAGVQDEQQVLWIIDNMLQAGATESHFQKGREFGFKPYEGFLKDRDRIFDDPRFNEFRVRDLERVMERYTDASIKRAEFERFFGDMTQLMEQAREQGATDDEVFLMLDAVDAAVGRYKGNKLDPAIRQTFAWIATFLNVLLLPFATLASLPDIVGPAIRAKDTKLAFTAFRDNISSLIHKADGSQLNQMARTWSIVMDGMNQHILTEQFDNHWFPERAKQINEKFFKAIGLEKWTNFTRATALAVGLDFMKTRAREAAQGDTKAMDELGELGLTFEEVQNWVDGGERVFGSAGYITTTPTAVVDEKIANAMIQFVDESVMRPNASQRPLWASNPAFLLLFHLKTFMFSWNETINKQIIQNVRTSNTPWQKAYQVALPGAMVFMLAALGLELRELLQYKLWGRSGRTDRMDADEYLWEITQRAGFLGPSQFGVDFSEAEERGQLPFLAISGPALGKVGELVSDNFSESIPKLIPGVAPFPAARDFVRGD